jgi:hypothetical protein
MKKGPVKDVIQWFRMSESLKGRVLKYQKRREKETGLDITLAGAIRDLIEKGLEAAS